MQHIGPPAAEAASALVKAAGDSDAHVRREAVMALYYTRPDRKLVIPVLAKALEDSDPAVRVAALDALTSLGDAAVPTLSKALEKPALRYWAALALGELGEKARPAVAALTAALKDDQPVTRREVLVALRASDPTRRRPCRRSFRCSTTKTKRSRMPRPLPWVAWARRQPAPRRHCGRGKKGRKKS